MRRAKVAKRDGLWQAWSPSGVWLGASSYYETALKLALGERLNLSSGGWYRSGSLNGIRMVAS